MKFSATILLLVTSLGVTVAGLPTPAAKPGISKRKAIRYVGFGKFFSTSATFSTDGEVCGSVEVASQNRQRRPPSTFTLNVHPYRGRIPPDKKTSAFTGSPCAQLRSFIATVAEDSCTLVSTSCRPQIVMALERRSNYAQTVVHLYSGHCNRVPMNNYGSFARIPRGSTSCSTNMQLDSAAGHAARLKNQQAGGITAFGGIQCTTVTSRQTLFDKRVVGRVNLLRTIGRPEFRARAWPDLRLTAHFSPHY
ncbi:hypothetical protein ANO11243_028840 [Dothideomycetidae sp. 11243]|nr:hypothetical protein ANO11243_028840 [fungal sp. No.11243]